MCMRDRRALCAFRTLGIYESNLSVGTSTAMSDTVNVFSCNKLAWIYVLWKPSGDNFPHDIYGCLLESGCISSLLLSVMGRCYTWIPSALFVVLTHHSTEELMCAEVQHLSFPGSYLEMKERYKPYVSSSYTKHMAVSHGHSWSKGMNI